MRLLIFKYAKYVVIAAISFSIGALLPLAAEIRKNSTERSMEVSKPSSSIEKFSKADRDQIIEVFKVWKLSSGLGLTAGQLVTFLPKYKKFESARTNFWNERRKAIDELKNLMQSDKKSEEQVNQVKALLKKLRELRLNFAKDVNVLEDELTQGLSVDQQANFFVLNDSFRQDIKQLEEGLKVLGKNTDVAVKR